MTLTRPTWVALLLATIMLAAVTLAITYGQTAMPWSDSLQSAAGFTTNTPADFIVGQLRAPRTYTATLVGALLACSGVLLQSVARNPLASPDILGVTQGAAAAAVASIWAFGNTSSLALAPAAVAGALLTSALIVGVGWSRGIQPMRLIVAGIGIGFVASSITTYLLTAIPEHLAPQAYLWTIGSTNARVWEHVAIAAAAVAVTIPLALWLERRLRVLEMGDDLASGLGVRPVRLRLAAIALGALAAGLAAALTGPIGFVALVAPAIARRLVRTEGIALVPSIVAGAALTAVADLLARELFSPTQVPIGLFTAAIGAPYLLYLLHRARGLRS
ncbi:iron ABC transporter permease [Demequina sp.]|uniref:FecCD family ABC transporter permease n=1 Tax=Demequina sp. TaxID=2050685 RepID=UPI0025C61C90|nr:iron ABC transporter permease [Demequina sp.]